MTTITREQLHERARRKVKELEFAITQSAFTSIRDGLNEELELARIALAALNDEPVAYNQVQRDMMKDIIVRKLGDNLLGHKLMMADIHAVTMALIQAGFRTAPPAPVADADPVVFTDERNLHHIARGRETSLIWGKQNQEVGDIPLYRHAQPAPVVPEEKTMPNHLSMYAVDAVAAIAEVRGWNACRAAMLHGVEQPQNARQNIPENIPDGNSPAIPDDWVMVPKEPTQAMINAWLSEVANWRGHVAGYKAALAAAPQQEMK